MDGSNLTALVALFVSAVNLLENKKLRAKLEELEAQRPNAAGETDRPG